MAKRKAKTEPAAGAVQINGTREEQLAQILLKLTQLDPQRIHGILVVVGTEQDAKEGHLNIVEFMAGDEDTLKALAAGQLMTLDEIYPPPDRERGLMH